MRRKRFRCRCGKKFKNANSRRQHQRDKWKSATYDIDCQYVR